VSPLAFYRQMIANGMDEATAYALAEKFEADREAETAARYDALLDRLAIDQKAERRREKDRVRKREAKDGIPRNSTESAEIAESPFQGSQGSLSPTPPNLPNPPNLSLVPPIVPQKSAKKARLGPPKGAFARFWAEYPLKVGKLAAERAYTKAWGVVLDDDPDADPEAQILGGLKRCKPLMDPEYLQHPTTWLNKGGWMDQPEVEAIEGGTGPPRLEAGAVERRREENRRMYGAAE
jgi:hypothetical protein